MKLALNLTVMDWVEGGTDDAPRISLAAALLLTSIRQNPPRKGPSARVTGF